MPIITQRKPRRLRKHPRHIMQIVQNGTDEFEDGSPAATSYEAADFNIIDMQTLVSSVSVPSNMTSPFTHTDCVKDSDNTIDSDGTNAKNCIHVSGSGVTVEIDATVILRFGTSPSGYEAARSGATCAYASGGVSIVYSNVVQQSSHGDTTRDYGTEVELAYWDAQYPADDDHFPASGRDRVLNLKYVHTTTTSDTWFWLRVSNYQINGLVQSSGAATLALPTLTVLGSQMTIRNV